ncbi:uncharacterized protein A4U43_C05F24160 [Asparagus officinalis]|uniref:Cation efflux protein transmembrane domain-containing protein n=1 Tax=Asparagus officinalis TaxID=4686 RepID=A0A5P1EYI7_ASPOF|nr:uncharacterized protein A4U43_C05F24160 [Asparagus officinalis]
MRKSPRFGGLRLLLSHHHRPKNPQPRSSSICSHLLSGQNQRQQNQQPEQRNAGFSSLSGGPGPPRVCEPSLLFHKKPNRDFWSSTKPPPGAQSSSPHLIYFVRNYSLRVAKVKKTVFDDETSQRAVNTALWCNFLVFSLKFGVWFVTSSHVMLAEVVHSVADFANQALLAYGLSSSRRAPDAMHPYGYSKERFVWSLISAVGIFCLGSGATIVHGFQNLWTSHPPENIHYAALVIGGSFLIEGASLLVAINAVKKGAAAEGMTVWDYVWRGHDPTSVAVMTEDGAAVTGLAIAAASLVAVNTTGNAIYDPIGSIIVGNLLGMVVDALYDCKSEVIGPGFFRFKAEIDFNGVVVVQNYLERTGREEWAKQFREAAKCEDDSALLKAMANYGMNYSRCRNHVDILLLLFYVSKLPPPPPLVAAVRNVGLWEVRLIALNQRSNKLFLA